MVRNEVPLVQHMQGNFAYATLITVELWVGVDIRWSSRSYAPIDGYQMIFHRCQKKGWSPEDIEIMQIHIQIDGMKVLLSIDPRCCQSSSSDCFHVHDLPATMLLLFLVFYITI